MTDIVSAPLIGVTAAGITIIGVGTGLDPALLFAGSCGGWWAASMLETPQPIGVRLNNIVLSSVIAAWVAPAAISALCEKGIVAERNELLWQYPTAAVIGFMVIPILGKLIMDGGHAARRALTRWIGRQGESK